MLRVLSSANACIAIARWTITPNRATRVRIQSVLEQSTYRKIATRCARHRRGFRYIAPLPRAADYPPESHHVSFDAVDVYGDVIARAVARLLALQFAAAVIIRA